MKNILQIIITLVEYYLIGVLLAIFIIGSIVFIETLMYNQYVAPELKYSVRAVFTSAFPLGSFYFLIKKSVTKNQSQP